MSEPIHEATPQSDELNPGDPFCRDCGYSFVGLYDSIVCPECGRPVVDTLVRKKGGIPHGKRFRSEASLFGVPLLHVAFGPRPEEGEAHGRARGIIAIGDTATGAIAIGGRAFGGATLGGLSIGVTSIGGGSIGLLSALGGGSISGGLAVGGGAIGTVAIGGGAAGFVAKGGGAVGYYVMAGGGTGKHVVSATSSSDEATEMFQSLEWLIGPANPRSMSFQPLVSALGAWTGLALAVAIVAIWAHRRAKQGQVYS